MENKKDKSFHKFLKKAFARFGNKFQYNKNTYNNTADKMEITCPLHGVFWQSGITHIRLVYGCPKCGFEATANHCRDTLETFIQKSELRHGVGRYDYSFVVFINSITKIKIRCPIHDLIFEQDPAAHVRGQGCPKCGDERGRKLRTYTTEEFKVKVRSIQGDEYDDSEMNYIDFDTKVKLICKEHGPFYKNPRDLISRKTGCPKCAGNFVYSTEECIHKFKQIHGERYGYGKVKYINNGTKVIITCFKHGDFEQSPNGHLQGYGCPKCSASKGEIYISNYLDSLNISYVTEYKIPKNKYAYDFYLPEYNIFIEFHGEQHYKYNKFFHRTREDFLSRKIIDDIKQEIVKAHQGKMITVPYTLLELNLVEEYIRRHLIRFGIPFSIFEK